MQSYDGLNFCFTETVHLSAECKQKAAKSHLVFDVLQLLCCENLHRSH